MYQPTEDTVPLFTEEEAATELRVKRGTLRNWRCKGIGPAYVKLGRHPFYPQKEIRSYIEGRIVQPEQEGA